MGYSATTVQDHHEEKGIASAIRKLARAIMALAKVGHLSESDQRMIDAVLTISESITKRTELFALALKRIDDLTPNR